jgi:hypothetical protein
MSHGKLFPISAHALKLAHCHIESKHHVPPLGSPRAPSRIRSPGLLDLDVKGPQRELPLTPSFEAEAPPP